MINFHWRNICQCGKSIWGSWDLHIALAFTLQKQNNYENKTRTKNSKKQETWDIRSLPWISIWAVIILFLIKNLETLTLTMKQELFLKINNWLINYTGPSINNFRNPNLLFFRNNIWSANLVDIANIALNKHIQ